tara:strand:+ start:842 stop:1225 length:384 start_codon:yes stop_codon:yes gene_type:complete
MVNKKTKLYTVLGNVSIAKFMGINPIKGVSKHSGEDYYYYNNAEMEDYEALPSYDCNWGCLMPIVEQINKRDWVTIMSDECKIHSLIVDEFDTIKIVKEGQPLISIVYDAVLVYIELNLKNKLYKNE